MLGKKNGERNWPTYFELNNMLARSRVEDCISSEEKRNEKVQSMHSIMTIKA